MTPLEQAADFITRERSRKLVWPSWWLNLTIRRRWPDVTLLAVYRELSRQGAP